MNTSAPTSPSANPNSMPFLVGSPAPAATGDASVGGRDLSQRHVAPAETSPACDAGSNALATTARVLHLINGEYYSGAERVQDLLGLRLPQLGFDVAFASLKPGSFGERRRSTNCPLYEVPMRHRWSLSVVRRIVEITRSDRYDLIHAHTPRSALVASLVAAQLGIPFVYHVHSPVSRDSTRYLINSLNSALEWWSLRHADSIVTVSASLAAYMRSRGTAQSKIAVVPNGVPLPLVVRPSEPPCASFHIGTVALFRPRKGTEILLRAMAQLRDDRCPCHLAAVGPFETPEYEGHLKALTADLGIEHLVTWHGFTADVADALSKMDVFVLPSLFGEGLPMVVLEAMAGGVPVIASRVEGVPEAIEDGVSGVLVPPGNASDLADGIRCLLSDPKRWKEVRGQAQRRHVERFSDTAMAQGIANVYRNLLGGRPAGPSHALASTTP